MAERAVHVSTTTNPTASILEVSAAESLQLTLHPALKSILSYLSPYHPLFNTLVKVYDELFLALHATLQRYYLNKHSSTFSEQVYGLKRLSGSGVELSTDDEKNYAFLYVVLLPYVRMKAEQYRNRFRVQIADGDVQNGTEKFLKSTFSTAVGAAEAAWRFWAAVQLIRYMSGRTPHHTPELQLQNQQLVYTGSETDETSTWLEFVAFFAQFIRSWWSDGTAGKKQLPTPPPPQYDSKAMLYRGVCGLCMQQWVVPTVVSVSGYVFCFRCIIHHLQTVEQCCPVTKLPANIDNLKRIYLR